MTTHGIINKLVLGLARKRTNAVMAKVARQSVKIFPQR